MDFGYGRCVCGPFVAGLVTGRERLAIAAVACAGFADWQDSTRPTAGHQFVTYYVFNITNPQAILDGATPIVQKVRTVHTLPRGSVTTVQPCSPAIARAGLGGTSRAHTKV